MSDYVNSLTSKFKEQEITPLMAGGWAVNHFGYTRATQDLDFIFCRLHRDTIIEIMKSMGYTMFTESRMASRFQHKEIYIPIIDAIWVDEATYSKMLQKAEPSSTLPHLKYISLEHLLSMKFHALHDHESRQGRDLNDIRELIQINSGALNKTTLLELCKKYAPAWASETLHLNSDD